MKDEAQKFMNQHRIAKCFECDGVLYKHEANAKAREKTSGKPVVPHEANAGPATKKAATDKNDQ